MNRMLKPLRIAAQYVLYLETVYVADGPCEQCEPISRG